ncbi:MAG: cupin domain-containing protein [Sulfuriferula sp.]|nr:cupin domain-containing protein [Sulfuriferula sp.]
MKRLAPYLSREDARGKLTGLMNTGTWEEFNYMETAAGQTRGNHYHAQTLEVFFILDGEIDMVIHQRNGEVINERLVAGDIVLIEIGETHTFHCVTNTRWINVLSRRFDQDNPDLHFNS